MLIICEFAKGMIMGMRESKEQIEEENLEIEMDGEV
jgi:hypothetical protein